HPISGPPREGPGLAAEDRFNHRYLLLAVCPGLCRRSCRTLSGPLLSLPAAQRDRAVHAILELPPSIEILTWKLVAPTMAEQHAGPGRRLNLLSREALAAAAILHATVVMAPGNDNRLLAEALHELGLD